MSPHLAETKGGPLERCDMAASMMGTAGAKPTEDATKSEVGKPSEGSHPVTDANGEGRDGGETPAMAPSIHKYDPPVVVDKVPVPTP